MILLVLSRPEDPPTASSQWNSKHRRFRRLWWHHCVSFKSAEKKRKMLKFMLMAWFSFFFTIWTSFFSLNLEHTLLPEQPKKKYWLYMGNNDNVQRRTWIMDDGSLWFCDFHTLLFCEDLIFWLLGTMPSNKGKISEDVFTLQKCLVLNDYFLMRIRDLIFFIYFSL